MNYRETLDYLYSKLPMFQRLGPAAYKKDLTNTLAFCKTLGDPQHRFRSIHIAGTNGKGSVSHFLASILQSQGYIVGLYTSPHLVDFRERIRISGQMIPEAEIVSFVEKLKNAIEEVQPSFFEVTVAMAFDYFAREKVDFAVIETGLGGRLDSTNVITPLLSVITNISYDHQNMLGNTLPEIAGEKAGIIKEYVPVVIGKYQEETAPVFESTAKNRNAALSYAERNFKVISHQIRNGFLELSVKAKAEDSEFKLTSGLAGEYQLENIPTVLEAVRQLRNTGTKISHKAVKEGIRKVVPQTGLRGRWEIVGHDPLSIVDVAHNEAGLRFVFSQIKSIPHQKLHMVYGMVRDKDIEKALSLLPIEAVYYFCEPNIPRALAVSELKEAAAKKGLQGQAYPSVKDAFIAARAMAGKEDLVLVAGSIFVAGEVLEAVDSNLS